MLGGTSIVTWLLLPSILIVSSRFFSTISRSISTTLIGGKTSEHGLLNSLGDKQEQMAISVEVVITHFQLLNRFCANTVLNREFDYKGNHVVIFLSKLTKCFLLRML